MPAIILSPNEISALQALLSTQGDAFKTTSIALAHPFPDLTDFIPDIHELVSRANDASSHIAEDFEEFLKALETSNKQLAKFVRARKI